MSKKFYLAVKSLR